jgi:hypothetical protein
MLVRTLPLAFLCALLLAAPGAAQGHDDCTQAQPIAGTGVFPFDNTNATRDGLPDPLCLAFGQSDIDRDVWFDWTPPASGVFDLNTCQQTSVDTKVGVYAGGCNSPAIACNDDACGLQSSLTFIAGAAQTYLIRLGSFPGAAGGTGTFTIAQRQPVLFADNGNHYLALRSPGIGWNEAQALAQSIVHQGVAGHLATLTTQAENDFVYSALGSVHWYWVGGYQDRNAPDYSEPAGGWRWVTGEPWGYTNWLPGEPNNTGAHGDEDFLELLDNLTYGKTWNDVHPLEHSQGLVIEWETGGGAAYCFGDGTGGLCPCGNFGGAGEGCANSSGAGARMIATGSTSVGADDLGFQTAQLLPNQPALLFAGLNQVNGGAGLPFGDGLRCAGTNVRRLGVRVPDAGGGASWGPGLAAAGGWAAGDIRRFQTWYRDPVNSPCGQLFNLSHGLELVFVP